MAARASGTITSGTPSPSGRSHTSATAPRSTASRANSWPSVLNPGTQKKSVPGATLLLLYARPEISTSGPSPMRSRRVIRRGKCIPGDDRSARGVHDALGPLIANGPPSIRRDAEVRQRERHDLLERRGGYG